jgi:hypothetical protein
MDKRLKVVDSDEQFFIQNPDRRAHIRNAGPHELNGEFWTLGGHDSSRRRILLWLVPDYHPLKKRYPFLKIPFLAFADETIEDTDEVLLPLIHQVMTDAAKGGAT